MPGPTAPRVDSGPTAKHPRGTSLALACEQPTSASQFQPRVVGLVVLLGIVAQQPPAFLALAALLRWCALLPRLNPFAAFYNAALARRQAARLDPAPAPRRFSEGMAGTIALAIGVAMLAKRSVAAAAPETMFVLAAGTAAVGGYCVGCFVFHFLFGRLASAQ